MVDNNRSFEEESKALLDLCHKMNREGVCFLQSQETFAGVSNKIGLTLVCEHDGSKFGCMLPSACEVEWIAVSRETSFAVHVLVDWPLADDAEFTLVKGEIQHPDEATKDFEARHLLKELYGPLLFSDRSVRAVAFGKGVS